jgi:phage tail-like protein
LLIHTGTLLPPLRLSLAKGYRKTGFFLSEAISVGSAQVHWHRVCAQVRRSSEDERVRLFVFTAQSLAEKPPIQFDAPNPFAAWQWRPRLGPPDPFLHLDDVFVWKGPTRKSSGRDEPTRYLWIGGFLSGAGTATPAVSQLRAEFDHASYLEHLPAVYRPAHRGESDCLAGTNDVSAGALQLLDSSVTKVSKKTFLLRLLSLFEGAFGEVEDRIAGMAAFFDAAAVPREYLGWLAAWFALDLDETWDEARQRQAVAQAFARAGRRGTTAGLREALRVFAGVDAVIEEPILNASCWVLPPAADVRGDCGCRSPNDSQVLPAEEGMLGFTTMLAAAAPQGAVLGTSATLDRSHLLTGENFGAPLFEDVAHQVNILVYHGQMCCDRTQALVRSVLDREKPAHVAYQLYIVAPRLRVGFQARVGMDAVVAGPAGPGQLGQSFALNQQATLAPPSHDQPQTRGRVGSIALAG